MNKTEYNNVFNQGVQASASTLEQFIIKPSEGKTLSKQQETFNSLIREFQDTIKKQLR